MWTIRGVVEARGDARLAAESKRPDRVHRVGQQPLQRDRALELLVEGPVDRAHSAGAHQAHDAIAPKLGARRQRLEL